jgi:hypothetical protein
VTEADATAANLSRRDLRSVWSASTLYMQFMPFLQKLLAFLGISTLYQCVSQLLIAEGERLFVTRFVRVPQCQLLSFVDCQTIGRFRLLELAHSLGRTSTIRNSFKSNRLWPVP